jgi:hypothetical protein
MAPYFIDGREAHGEDYAKAIDALQGVLSDYPAEVCIETSDKRGLTVCRWPDGVFRVLDKMSDGSEWRTPALSKEQVNALLGSFLSGEEWRKGLLWEPGTPATKDVRLRALAVFLVTGLLFAFAMWSGGFFNRQVNFPRPPQEKVEPKDFAGTWYYRGAAPGTVCEITLNTNGTYSLIHRRSNIASTNTGAWGLPGVGILWLYPFYTSSASGRGVADRTVQVEWRLTCVASNRIAPFGGDSLEANQWAILSRTPVKPRSQPIATMGSLGMVAALIFLVCAGLFWWKVRIRAETRERSSKSNIAAALLPQLQRLREEHLEGAPVAAHPTLAHKRLLAMARRFVAHFAYFRKPEPPDPAASRESQDHNA